MAQVIQLEADARQVLARMAGLPPAVRVAVLRRIKGALLVLQTKVRQNAENRFPRGGAGLAGRITSFAVLSAGGDVDGAIGFRRTALFPYELSQEFGANAGRKAMAIPVSKEAKGLSARGMGPRDMVNLFLLRTPTNAVLAERLPGRLPGGKLEIHWVLKKSIPPRLNFRRTMQQHAGRDLSAAIMAGVREGMANG